MKLEMALMWLYRYMQAKSNTNALLVQVFEGYWVSFKEHIGNEQLISKYFLLIGHKENNEISVQF